MSNVRLIGLSLGLIVLLSACAPSPPVSTDGRDGSVYRISNRDTARVQFRMLDAVNALRAAAAAPPLELNSQLNAAAATHARDMAVQNRPWHFGSDGSSPLERVQRAGYPGKLMGENISETYESELETLAAWMEEPGTRNVILSPIATDLGFSWHQERSGKIWWTLVTGQRFTPLEPAVGF